MQGVAQRVAAGRCRWASVVKSFCTALKPPASPAAERHPGGRCLSGRSRPTPSGQATTMASAGAVLADRHPLVGHSCTKGHRGRALQHRLASFGGRTSSLESVGRRRIDDHGWVEYAALDEDEAATLALLK